MNYSDDDANDDNDEDNDYEDNDYEDDDDGYEDDGKDLPNTFDLLLGHVIRNSYWS